MYRKIGLLILYVLLIASALGASTAAPIENPLVLIVIWCLVLALVVVFVMIKPYRNR